MTKHLLLLAALMPTLATAQNPRGRALGIPFEGKTGPYNAITDVPGVAVGHSTIIKGEGKLVPGVGPIRTGVTAILPRPRGNWDFVMAATFNQNGNGDMTGVNWIEESGFLEGPILLTGTHSVGVVRDAALQWQLAHGREFIFTDPVVAETFDFLNDANGQHVKPEHAWAALDAAQPGGLGKLGSWAGNGSGDLFLAFSTANPGAAKTDALAKLEMVPNDAIDPFFRATIAATEEAVVNAMLAAPATFTGG